MAASHDAASHRCGIVVDLIVIGHPIKWRLSINQTVGIASPCHAG